MQCHAETTAQLPGRHIASAGGIAGGSTLLLLWALLLTAFAMNESKRTWSSPLSSSLSGELAPCEPDEYFEGPEFDPAQRHVTVAMGDLALPVTEGGRIIFVGDVHGCFDELQELLEIAQRDPARDTVVLLGDMVRKGPKSVEVVRWARENGALAVRGNHDDAALAMSLRRGKYSEARGDGWAKGLSDDDLAPPP